MRKLIYFIATTLDGFIAREDGSLDGFSWNEEFIAYLLSEFPETIPAHLKEETGSRDQNRVFDTVLMGRKTYEVGLKHGVTNPYPTLDQFVFSRTMKESPDENITLISENAVEIVRSLKEKPGKAIWICGGSESATLLLKFDLIDQIIVKVNPMILSSGIQLFSGENKQRSLFITDKRGHLLLHYKF